ncbi:MAG: DUF4412 domain-containing protein [Candidatus Obscuribacterales bacterium]|nr:DUF4412 domain-containing protein [Candidatus Obscuribacterales bacterium]
MTKKSSCKWLHLSLSVVALAQLALPSLAAGPTKAFEATVESAATGGTSQQWSDGKGHLRSESMLGGVKRVSILDFNTMTSYSINDQNKTITQMPLSGGESDPSMQWTPIGNKVIDGHPCQGKRSSANGSVYELWTGTDTGCTVLLTSNGSPVQKLKSWTAATPSAAMFSLPSGYKTVDMSAMMKRMQSAMPAH